MPDNKAAPRATGGPSNRRTTSVPSLPDLMPGYTEAAANQARAKHWLSFRHALRRAFGYRLPVPTIEAMPESERRDWANALDSLNVWSRANLARVFDIPGGDPR